MLVGDGLTCLRGGRAVFVDLSFRIEPGAALVIQGPNGSGKSSLLRLMAGLIRPAAGTLSWDGVPVAADPDRHRARIAYVGHRDAVKPVLSALDNLALWAGLADPREAVGRARLALDAVGLAEVADLPARYLSAGQSRRLALARPLATGRRLWLLDEPTTGLDRDSERRFEAILARHRDGGGAVALATHAPVAIAGPDTLDMRDVAPADDAADAV